MSARPTARSPAPDANLYGRGRDTLIASWEEYARGSEGAGLVRSGGFAAAVFPAEPARSVYTNVILRCGQRRADRLHAIDEIGSVS